MLFIFDMGGVVTSTFSMNNIYQKLNLTQESFMELCKKNNDNIWHKLETGLIQTQEFWQLFNQRSKELSIPPVTNDLFRLYFHPVLNNQTVELIQKLKKNHRVVCGTNTIQSHWENHLERGDYSYFDQTYASNKIGAAKPSHDFYQLILEAEGCNPKTAFFTDDKIENITAAKECGINAVQFTSPQDLLKLWERYI